MVGSGSVLWSVAPFGRLSIKSNPCIRPRFFVAVLAAIWLAPSAAAAPCVDYADPLADPTFVEFDLLPDGEIADCVFPRIVRDSG